MSGRRARGFTLIETLVAMTLLALLFGALLPVFQNGLTLLGRADRNQRAVQLAESLLAREAALVPAADDSPPAGDASGVEDGFAWSVLRAPYAGDDGIPAPQSADAPLALELVTAVVTWDGDAHGVRLSTLGVVGAR